MRNGLALLLVVLFLTGALWLGQGLGYIHGSFMTGERLWAGIGAGCMVAAAGGAWLLFAPGHSRRG